MFKIFYRNLRHHKLAYGLNILGLVVAFLLFTVLISQVKYDFSFDKFHRDSQNIYRLERIGLGGQTMSWVNFISAQEFVTSSPNIESAAIVYPANKPTYVITENKQGKVGFIEDIVPSTPGITDVFDFKMIEGVSSLLEPANVMIPETMATRMYGEESAIGRSLFVEKYIFGVLGNLFTITGVYNDFPNNSQLRNAIYIKISDKRVEARNMNNFNVYARLNNSGDSELVESNFYENYYSNRSDCRFIPCEIHNFISASYGIKRLFWIVLERSYS